MISSPVSDILMSAPASASRPYVGLMVRTGAWIVVPWAGQIPRDGLAVYNPQKLRGMLVKALVRHGLWMPPAIAFRDDVVTEIESFLGSVLGLRMVRCAFYFRSPGLYSKTILLVLDEHGRAVAYAKLGSTSESNAAVAHEGSMLERLEQIPELAEHIPHVIAHTAWREFPMLVLSVGPSHRMSSKFGNAHRRFLRALGEATTCSLPLHGSLMWARMSERFAANEALLDPAWRERYAWALGEIERRLGTASLAFGLAHRDFVPWNMQRRENGELFVFDWELAQDQCVRGWDFFHFHLASRASRTRRTGQRVVGKLLRTAEREVGAPADGNLLAYLTDVGLFLHDRLIKSPGEQENHFLGPLENAIDTFRQRRRTHPIIPPLPVARDISA